MPRSGGRTSYQVAQDRLTLNRSVDRINGVRPYRQAERLAAVIIAGFVLGLVIGRCASIRPIPSARVERAAIVEK